MTSRKPPAPVPGWLAAERAGSYCVGPGSDWDPLAAREMNESLRLGDLANHMTRVAARLRDAVHAGDRDAVRLILGSLTPYPLSEDVAALLVVAAGMIPAGADTADLLAWLWWDE